MSIVDPQNIGEIKPVHHRWCYLNGEFVETNIAALPITTQAFNYGTAVFEGIRGYINYPDRKVNIFRLNEHVKRLCQSASLLLIDDLPEPHELKELILSLLKRNETSSDCYIRPIAYKRHLLPGSGFGVKLSGVSNGLSVNSLNMRTYVKQDGIACTISNWCRVADNSIPARAKITGSYVNSALAMEAAQHCGYNDAIMLNINGYVAEATTSNIFIVKNRKLITPPVSAHILEGITRDTVITLATTCLGLKVEERNILPSELLTADECFLTGTGVEIAPVSQIDHHKLNSMNVHGISIAIKDLYEQSVRGKLDAFSHWLTPVF
ncbi:branched-chain amino acid transaminase [Salmonella enterica]|uniref:Branched-chain-amino-acid aminotransferase n=1 Tax=Salmonella enterica I TaxID=59201 RepID=A0A7Z1PDQ1_SALET|nr:branched-chain amino acid transaminase [Salmonella enterica]ECC9067861.1 branched-chain amino acid aminotransferase [Salmonella enterica subsp. diarizonae]EAU1518255.1 branched-chain amino acid transaminase [Salmonella enterica]EBG9725238.1 branched-chain amino acid transaminase [Salmonella enterica]ECI0840645.1 branched-chain amino acid transaminase [Salmonella enterica subsp. diarizonae]ECT8479372.1 branched-chain amino acid transaminase [Salmonella enterica]